jgi:peroxiredoxin
LLQPDKEDTHMRTFTSQWKTISLLALILGVGSAGAAEPPAAVRATIQPIRGRKQAPAFWLENAAGKKVRLSDYHGRAVLLDFWATECGGCVREMPGFMDLAQAYKKQGLTVVGVSMDISYEDLKNSSEAWSRVNPFVEAHKVNYQILMGDDQVTKRYDIQALPLTYLIDRRGRIAASYAGVVDKDNVESNIQTVLKESKR